MSDIVNHPNRLFTGWCSNEGNPRSCVLHYIIRTIRDLSNYDGDIIPEEVKTLEEYFNLDEQGIGEPYYCVYITFKLDIKKGSIKIFETDDLKSAIFVAESLSGNKVRTDNAFNN